ncbi:Protein kinase domain-containing protein [Aphelenchoides bicaudatus]|nr:Protein kinase domain-containing protein [Aphelenchoides bicaudatus]
MLWRACRLFWHMLLISCLISFVQSVSTIQKDDEKPSCTDFVCTRHSLKTETRTFVEDVQNDDGKQIECKTCSQCTDSGYSFCLKANDGQCLCSQELPRGCAISTRTGFKPVPEKQMMNICYASSLRNPPRPAAIDEPNNNDLILTIDQFWLKNYWKHMKLENLTLFYEFPIHSPHLCDGMITTINKQRVGDDEPAYLCTPSLKIELEEEPIDSRENSDGSISHDDYDNNLPPEIQFERAVFDGAPHVRFYYRIQVRRERQLNAHNAVVERLSMLTSDVLTYNLESKNPRTTPTTQVYKTTTKRLPTTSSRPLTTPAINKVNIEQRPQKTERKESAKPNEKQAGQDKDSASQKNGSFLDKHLNNGGQFQLIVLVSFITLGICVVLIVGTFLYRRHIGNAKRSGTKMPATKQMNGFEYRATIQDER